MNTQLNQMIPEIFDNPAWESRIELLQYFKVHGNVTSVIRMHPDVLRTIEATNPENLKPFKHWKITASGNIQLTSMDRSAFSHPANFTRHGLASPINESARRIVEAGPKHYRDVRMAQANDRDEPEGY